jgi:hypothetical protein
MYSTDRLGQHAEGVLLFGSCNTVPKSLRTYAFEILPHLYGTFKIAVKLFW